MHTAVSYHVKKKQLYGYTYKNTYNPQYRDVKIGTRKLGISGADGTYTFLPYQQL